MTILDCSVTGCMYNEANCCHKGNIKVEGEDAKESEDTCCGSFAERGDRCAKNVTGDAPKNIEVACCAADQGAKLISGFAEQITPKEYKELLYKLHTYVHMPILHYEQN